ncbi:hypothetical protein G6F68_021083 [Rhizopus microsporus]|nr:hypothetical protein G6F68_021083 [Rhizopus microsporus]
MSTAILALEDVTVAYHGDITILNRIKVQARAGQVTGVIGPNGAGKSTPVCRPVRARQPAAGLLAVPRRQGTGAPADRLGV